MGGLPAGERAAEHFAQRRQGIAFVLGEGEQGAQRRGLHHRRVGSGSTLGVNQAAGATASPLCRGDAGFTKGDGAGGVVQQQRRMARAGNTTHSGLVPKRLSPRNGATIGSPMTLTK